MKIVRSAIAAIGLAAVLSTPAFSQEDIPTNMFKLQGDNLTLRMENPGKVETFIDCGIGVVSKVVTKVGWHETSTSISTTDLTQGSQKRAKAVQTLCRKAGAVAVFNIGE